MAKFIKCPVCGENNISDQEFCQFCQSPLRPAVESSKGADEGFKPGQAPTKKVTADLEPILPEWLRQARNSARNSEIDDIEPQSPSQESSRSSSPHDLLAGLQAQSESNDDEDVPDWLTSITGAPPSSKKSQADPDVRWVEMGGAKDFAVEESPADSETPSWSKNLAPSAAPSSEINELTDWMREASGTKPQQSQPPASAEPSDTSDWLRQMAADSGGEKERGSFNETAESFNKPSAASDTPDWLRQMAANNDVQKNDASFNSPPASDSDKPDWLSRLAADDGAQGDAASFNPPPASSDTPDWLSQMAADDGVQKQNKDTTFNSPPASDSDVPDWLSSIGADDGAQNKDASINATPAASDSLDWLSSIGAQDQGQVADSAGFSETGIGESDALKSTSTGDTPDWLKGLYSGSPSSPALSSDDDWLKGFQLDKTEQPAQAEPSSWLSNEAISALKGDSIQQEEPAAPASDEIELGDVPSWLKAAAPHSSIYGDASDERSSTSAPIEDASADWLNTFKSMDTPKAPAFSVEEPVGDVPPPAFTPDAQAVENMDALFADMPDWLAGSVDIPPAEPAPAAPISTPIENSDALAAGELPAWVQAMRPVDTGDAQLSSTLLSSDQTLESRGALAGLQGVLPAAAGYAPTSKPKAYSIKLQASEEQQAHAVLLEQILAAETEPVPIASFSALRASRSLRWFLAFILIAAVTTILAMRTQIFAMPVGSTLEINGALQVAGSIPEGAPVLVVFDYEPARVGEMEAIAAPMFDQMLVLRHPHLTFISTNESGLILAERFISGPLGGHAYQSGSQYFNLGYLPGGPMGISAFAQNPSVSAPLLVGVNSLSQFAAMIIITDNADSTRAWIEQTTFSRGAIPVVVISSAQAAPVIQPYFASQQIAGLVSGMYGGAVYEQNNTGRPGTARAYWDAYSLGMLLAMVLVLGGGLWNLALGLRDRAAAREAK